MHTYCFHIGIDLLPGGIPVAMTFLTSPLHIFSFTKTITSHYLHSLHPGLSLPSPLYVVPQLLQASSSPEALLRSHSRLLNTTNLLSLKLPPEIIALCKASAGLSSLLNRLAGQPTPTAKSVARAKHAASQRSSTMPVGRRHLHQFSQHPEVAGSDPTCQDPAHRAAQAVYVQSHAVVFCILT